MKIAGFVIMVFGLLLTIFTGLNYVTQEVVIESGDMNITRDATHGLSWSPFIGVGVLILGVLILIGGVKRSKTIKADREKLKIVQH